MNLDEDDGDDELRYHHQQHSSSSGAVPPSAAAFEDVADDPILHYPAVPPITSTTGGFLGDDDEEEEDGEVHAATTTQQQQDQGEEDHHHPSPSSSSKLDPSSSSSRKRAQQPSYYEPTPATSTSTSLATTTTAPPPVAKPSLQTRVLEPRVVGEPLSSSSSSSAASPASGLKKDKFVVYRVETQVNDATLSQVQFDGHATFSVLRRFSDFDWLHSQLEQKYLGFIVPPLPDKTVPLLQNNLSEHFYTTRARALDKFLAHVTSHAVLSRDSAVREFLIAEQHRFESLRRGTTSAAAAAVSQPSQPRLVSHYSSLGGGSGDFSSSPPITGGGGGGGGGGGVSVVASGFFEKVLDWGSSLKEQVGTSFSGTAKMGAELRHKTSADELFDDAVRYVDEMEPKLKLCFDVSKRIVAQNTELAKAMHELGLAFTSVGQSEQNAELSRTITELGNVCGGSAGVGLLLTSLVTEEEAKFLEPIEDYVRLISAAKQALAIRTKMCSAYEVALGELHFKREAAAAKSSKTGMGMGSGGEELAELERRCESAKSDFDLVTDRVVKEIDRFKREKARDFKALILDYVQLQIDHNVRVERLWSSLLPRLGVAVPPSANAV